MQTTPGVLSGILCPHPGDADPCTVTDYEVLTLMLPQKDSMFTATAGDRPDVPNVAIVVWDGIPTSDWQQAIDYAIQARQRGIRIIGFGVGTDVQSFGLSSITSWPSSETVFVAESSSQLPALRDQIVNATCNSESKALFYWIRAFSKTIRTTEQTCNAAIINSFWLFLAERNHR